MMARLETAIHPGDQLGGYRIDGLVARSRTSNVFRATDVSSGSQVAIKVPQQEIERDQNFADWFRREREIAQRLDHPSVVKVIGDPAPDYLVMEWFEGKPLREILDQEKRLPAERAVRIAVEICNALEYLHSHGIIHLDLQPENILIGAGDRIRLIDFGGAAKTKARRLTFTKVSQLTGVSPYVSPEELLGRHGDARSDIYSMGAILYEMVTGQRPFLDPDPQERLLNYPVPPRELDPGISPQLQEVIYRALEREPKARYSSAREFAVDLTHLEQVGVADRPELREWRKAAKSPWKRVALYAALALIPIAILALLLFFARH